MQTGCKAAIFFGYGWWGGDASPPIPNGVSAPDDSIPTETSYNWGKMAIFNH